MDILKKKRTVYRADFTRILNILNKLLPEEKADKVEEKNAVFKLLEEKYNLLKSVDEQILDIMIFGDLDAELNAILEDRSTSDNYTIQFIKISELIKNKNYSSHNLQTSSMITPSSNQSKENIVKDSGSSSEEIFIQAQELTGNKYINSTITVSQYQSMLKPKAIHGLRYNLPGNPEHEIIGREDDAEKVYKLLMDENNSLNKNRVVITGTGGIGKTTFVVYCIKKWKFDNVAFLHSEDEFNFEKTVQGLAIHLNIDKSLSNADILKKVSEIYKEKKLLLVLDNLEKLQVVKDVLELPSNVYVLGTSQLREFKTKFQEYQLSVLSVDNSRKLIISIFGPVFSMLNNSDTESEVGKLITKLDGYPLSLVQAASMIQIEIDNLCDFGEEPRNTDLYIKTIDDFLYNFDQRIKDSFPDQFITINSKSTYVALKMNIEKVSNTIPHDALTMLAIMGNLDKHHIKKNMFYVLFDEHESKYALTILKKMSFIIEEREHIDEVYLDIHCITQYVIRLVLDKVIWQDKVAFYTLLFDQSYECAIKEKTILKNFKLCDCINIRNNLRVRIESAFSVLKNNIKNSLDILEKSGCKTMEYENYSNWPLSHKLILASDTHFNIKLMIDLLNAIEHEEELTKVNNCGLTILHLIVTKNIEKSIITYLTNKFLDHTILSMNITPLHIAIEFTRSENCFSFEMSAWELLINKSTINDADINGNTILHKISKKGLFYNSKRYRQDLIEILYQYGAKLDVVDNVGDSPIHIATREKNPLIIYLFYDLAKDNDIDLINLQNQNGDTPLHIAIEPLKYLQHLQTTNDESNFSTEIDVIQMVSKEISDDIIRLLNTIKIKCNARTDIPNKNGETVIEIVNKYGYRNLSKWLQKSHDELISMDLIWNKNDFIYK